MDISTCVLEAAWRELERIALLLNYTMCRLDEISPLANGTQRTRYKEQADRSLVPSVPDQSESERIQNELDYATSLKERAFTWLQRNVSELFLRPISPFPDTDEGAEPIKVLYRPIAIWTQTFYSRESGFCCDSLLKSGRLEPTQDLFLRHMRDESMDGGSPYISLMSRPGRIYRKFSRTDWDLGMMAVKEVALIDPQKLARMGIPCDSVRDLGEKFSVPEGTRRRGDADFLAEFWIPAVCIIATLRRSAFEKVLIDCGIVDEADQKATDEAAEKLLDVSSFLSAIDQESALDLDGITDQEDEVPW